MNLVICISWLHIDDILEKTADHQCKIVTTIYLVNMANLRLLKSISNNYLRRGDSRDDIFSKKRTLCAYIAISMKMSRFKVIIYFYDMRIYLL